jgi:putative membrane-bound dehydrogenase-like protein
LAGCTQKFARSPSRGKKHKSNARFFMAISDLQSHIISDQSSMNTCIPFLRTTFLALALGLGGFISQAAGPVSPVRVLFLGDDGPHRPAERFKQIYPVLTSQNIEVVYTASLDDLNQALLAGFDCLLIYANHTRISPEQEEALFNFVEAGGGLAAIHSASYCFHNSPRYIELVGAQFRRHGEGVFRETLVRPGHEILKNLEAIESWDETYVHHRHNQDRLVLAERREGDHQEPWTWVREHGKGRVFYTAWGHDHRTWSNAGFHKLIENGIRWAAAHSPQRLVAPPNPPFEHIEAPSPLPNYIAGAKWGTTGEPITTMQKPLDPEASLERMVTLPGFEISLFASEPGITKPIWLDWDARGRLWIAETIDYPNELQPPGKGRDRIKICEDTTGDGRADKFTVFADQLSVPTSFVFANGGIIVAHSGVTEFLQDTTGDDQADGRRVLFSGWGMQDTHAGPSNLRYGFDGWIYGVVGYSGFRGTVGDQQHRFGQGIFRFKPDGSAMEFLRSSNNNTWGLGLTEDNLIFGSTANNNASMYLGIPNRYYESVRGWSASRLETIADNQAIYPITSQVRQVDWHGRYTAGSGSAIYTARSFPSEYWNQVQFVAEPTGHLLGKFHLRPSGADYIAHNGRNFAASDDEWSSPIAAEVGPDGALWMIDWYNYIIQHNPTPAGFQTGKGNAYETPLRDKVHGRIHRITWKNAPPSIALNLEQATPAQLVSSLKNDNLLWRMRAQRRLVERRNLDVVPSLINLLEDQTVDAIGLNPAAIHALWTLRGLGALESGNGPALSSATAALKHPSAAVRRAALMALPRNGSLADLLIHGGVLRDPDPKVRLAALLALSELPPSNQSGAAVLSMLQEPVNAEDRWIVDAAISAAARHDAGFLTALLSRHTVSETGSAAQPSPNLIPNPSFEEGEEEAPLGWRKVNYRGPADLTLSEISRTGRRSVRISSTRGADASWSIQAPVQPNTDYLLAAWIRTENVQRIGSARGALLNIHELQDPENGATQPLTGTHDWTRVELRFNSGQRNQLTVNCLFGGWGVATGTAWFDDLELIPAPASRLPGELGRAVRIVTGHYAQRAPVESIVPTLAALKGASPELSLAFLEGLVSGWPQGAVPDFTAADQQTLTSLMADLDPAVRDRLIALAQRWERVDLFAREIDGIIQALAARVRDGNASEADRISAAQRLAGLDDRTENLELLLGQVTLLTPPSLANGLVTALAEGRNPQTGKVLTAHWRQLTPAVRRSALAALLRRPDWTLSLLEAVESGLIQKTDLAAEHWSQLKIHPSPEISSRALRLETADGRISDDLEETVNELLPLARKKGDPVRGREVYAANCASCHIFNGAGGTIGPDLTGIGARDRVDVLVDILDPNRSVEANYRLWTVTTNDGETLSGRLEAETQTSVEILDLTGHKHVIQRRDIAALDESPLSIMPGGFEALPPEDLVNLLEYLAL